MLHTRVHRFAVIGAATILASCGGSGGGGNDNNDPALVSGYFLDSAVEGLEYSTYLKSGGPPPDPITYNPTRAPGITDKNGTFKYKEGEFVGFRIGSIHFEIIPAKQIMTPYDLGSDVYPEGSGNIATFLQSLDNDATLSNGIEIIEAVRDHTNTFTSFPGFSAGFLTGMPPIIRELTSFTDAGERDMLDRTGAVNHLNNTLNSANPGSYPFIYGFYSGGYSIDVSNCSDPADNGSYEFSVELAIRNQDNENFTGSATGTTSHSGNTLTETIAFTGSISTSGDVSGDTTHVFVGTEGIGTFSGDLTGDVLAITNAGSDTSGDTCTYVRDILVSR